MKSKMSFAVGFCLFVLSTNAQNTDSLNNQNSSNYPFLLFQKSGISSKNFVFSPYSIKAAVSLLYVGSKEKTRNEIASVFGFPVDESEFFDREKSQNELLSEQKNDNLIINCVNSLWFDNNMNVLDSYKDNCRKSLIAEINFVDFLKNAENSRKEINGWVAQKTKDKIPNLLPEGAITAQTCAVLVNAVYFNAKWEKPFPQKNTKKDVFYGMGSEKQCDFMNATAQYYCQANDLYTAVSLPYVGNEMEMLLVMPSEKSDFVGFANSLSVEKLKTIATSNEQKNIKLSVPKFHLKTDLEITGLLKDGGMPSSFSPSANLSAMSPTPGLHVTNAYHSTFIKVNEEGTEAASGTALVIGRGIDAASTHLVFNRPFIFAVRERKNSQILFLGICADPIQEN